MSFESIQYHTAKVLRDYPQLRSVDKREKVWKKVQLIVPNCKFSTVERCIRKIQNEFKMWLPEIGDNRKVYENAYKNFFK